MLTAVIAFIANPWNIFGIFGQVFFASRFIIQWFVSEMEGRSVIPLAFWYCSVGGGVMLLTYAIYREEPVFIAGQAGGLIVYGRNLYLIFREKGRRSPKNEAKAEVPRD